MIDKVKDQLLQIYNVLEKILNLTVLSYKSKKLIEKILDYVMSNKFNTTIKPRRISRK